MSYQIIPHVPEDRIVRYRTRVGRDGSVWFEITKDGYRWGTIALVRPDGDVFTWGNGKNLHYFPFEDRFEENVASVLQ